MIILIAGASHTGKTVLAQKLLEKYAYPYLSIDHLKMGLIRSGETALTPEDDDELKPYLWKIVREIIKTAIENKQNLIVEGIYIPFDWKEDFTSEYLKDIVYRCLIMSDDYIKENFQKIISHGNVIEDRLDDELDIDEVLAENIYNLKMCEQYDLDYILIDGEYEFDLEI